MDYFIKTNLIESECLVLPLAEYHALRNLIIQHLLTVYERVDYKDADWRHYEIIIVGSVGSHLCTHCFHAEKWVNSYRNATLASEIGKRLDWGRQQIDLMGDSKIPHERMGAKQPITATTVFRTNEVMK